MKRKTSNILLCVLAAVVIGCGVMAAGTMNGWFGGNEQAQETVQQTEAAAEAESEEDADADTAEAAEQQPEQAQQSEQAKQQNSQSAQAVSESGTCTITIKCSSILKNKDKLSEGKAGYVPSNGIILSKSTVEFKDGNTVYDVLRGTCSAAGIPLSARSSSMGIYVEGINGLFEFDCGGTSGWMYSVNGNSPDHGCDQHKVRNGDNIVWYYTCGN